METMVMQATDKQWETLKDGREMNIVEASETETDRARENETERER